MKKHEEKNLEEVKYVRYKEGAEKYSMCQSSFEKYAKKAGAVIKMGKIALVDCAVFEAYLNQCRVGA